MTIRTITRTEVALHLVERGARERPTIVCVHGFPDSHRTWDEVAERLADAHHVVAYDVRGAGRSSAPARREGYRIERLADDLVAVIEAVRPDGAPVHVVGHDWGSVQLWGILGARDPRLAGRIASFTSISGPPLDGYERFLRGALIGPERRAAWGQLVRSWYVGFFQLPWLPEFVFGRFGSLLARRLAAAEGIPGLFGDTFARDGANGVNLYRVNRPRRRRGRVEVPVQLIVPRRDAFVGVPLTDAIARRERPARRVDLEAGHWVIRSHPDEIATLVAEFVAAR